MFKKLLKRLRLRLKEWLSDDDEILTILVKTRDHGIQRLQVLRCNGLCLVCLYKNGEWNIPESAVCDVKAFRKILKKLGPKFTWSDGTPYKP